MILGDICTRDCKFCAVETGFPEGIDPNEPSNVALAAKNLGLKYVVVTSVSRDDLVDAGAEQFANTIKKIREIIPDAKVEVLIPDFQGNEKIIKKLIIDRAESNIILKTAREEGMLTLFQDALQRAYQGVTTIEEVLRVTYG